MQPMKEQISTAIQLYNASCETFVRAIENFDFSDETQTVPLPDVC